MITRERARELRAVIEGAVSTYDMEDSEALKVVELFPTWETLLAAGNALAENTILNDGGILYRVVQPGGVVPQEHQPPHGEGMLAVYRPIDQTHAGTVDDPIPFVYGMDTEKDKYYSYEGKTYLCNLAMAPCVWVPDTPGLWQWTLIEWGRRYTRSQRTGKKSLASPR